MRQCGSSDAMEQGRKVTAVYKEMEDKSSWVWLKSKQIGFPLRSDFANESQGE